MLVMEIVAGARDFVAHEVLDEREARFEVG
jgi:hypothetical protein